MNLQFRVFVLVASIFLFSQSSSFAQEFERRALGARYLSADRYSTIPLAIPPTRGLLPTDVDLTNYFPVPGDQGQQPSCVAWAVAYAMKTYQEKRERDWDLSSSAHVFSPAALYNETKVGGCDSGSYVTDAFDAIMNWGAISLADFPYKDTDCTRLPTSIEKSSATKYRIQSVRTVNIQSTAEIKSHLAAEIPVVVAFDVYDNFFGYSGGVYSSVAGSVAGVHAVSIVGYDDARNAFRAINSWGPTWGDGGYFWISYQLFKSIVREAYVSRDLSEKLATRTGELISHGDVTLTNGFENFDASGYDFSEKKIVSWNSDGGDFLFAKPSQRTISEPGAAFFPFDAPPYNAEQDRVAQAGLLAMGDITPLSMVDGCPIGGYRYHWIDIQVGQTYCVRARDGDNFFVVRVVDLDAHKIVFEWFSRN